MGFLGCAVLVGGLRQSISEVEKVFGDSDGFKHFRLGVGMVVIVIFIAEKFFAHLLDTGLIENLITGWTLLRMGNEKGADHGFEFFGEVGWDFGINALNYFFVQACHIFCSKRRF
jgi:hypothetical protein